MNHDPRTWKAIVFDFDGTLAELNIDFSAMRAALLHLLAEAKLATDEISHLPILELMEAAAARFDGEDARTGFLAAAQRTVTEMEMAAAQRGRLYDGVRGLLTDLGARSIRIGVVTRNCRAAVYTLFPDIDRYCQAVLTREDPPRVKPHPDHLRAALEVLGVSPAAAVMIGDHPMDIRIGRETGTDTIGVLGGSTDRQGLLEERADFIIDHISDIIRIIS